MFGLDSLFGNVAGGISTPTTSGTGPVDTTQASDFSVRGSTKQTDPMTTAIVAAAAAAVVGAFLTVLIRGR